MRIEDTIKLDFNDVLIRPKRSTLTSRKEVDMERHFTFKHYGEYRGIPVVASNMDGVGTFAMAKKLNELRLFTCLTKTYSVVGLTSYFHNAPYLKKLPLNVAMSIGIKHDDLKKFMAVYRVIHDLQYVNIDVANGYTQRFIEFISNFRKQFPDITIIAGNVVTADQTQELILNGADIVKVGIGQGSVCTTRIQTGVGYPQLSAIMECADAAHGLGGHIIADGGCTCAGDVAKAFAAGADFVMLGGMLAGHDESEIEPVDGKISFYGMSSKAANDKHFGGLDTYKSSEGREVSVPYRGAVQGTIQNILGGVRSTCTYVGAKSLKQLSKCTTFIRTNSQYNNIMEYIQ